MNPKPIGGIAADVFVLGGDEVAGDGLGGAALSVFAQGNFRAQLNSHKRSNAWLTVSLEEGKNREVRRLMEHCGYLVTRLIRIAYGPFQLGKLTRGQTAEVPTRVLRQQLGEGVCA